MRVDSLRRGWLEFGLIAMACMLVAAAVLGSGIAQSALNMPNPLTWLNNGDGHITQANPDTGRTGDKLLVAEPGDELLVTQEGGVLTVTNTTDNTVTIIDLSTLTFSGTRRGNAGVEVLLSKGRVFLADKASGRVERLDELTAQTVGAPLEVGKPLADAAASKEQDALWLLDTGGQLIQARYEDSAKAFAERDRRSVPAGEQAVLVAHEIGVTVFDPRGSVTQIGTGDDGSSQAPPVVGPLIAAEASPQDIVPVVAPEDSAVLIVADGKVSTVDSAAQACAKPGRPAVFRDLVHVPCIDDRKVIIFDRNGAVAAPPITLPAGRPELVLNAGLLIVNVIGAEMGKVIKPDGTVQDIRTRDPLQPAADPTRRPTAVPSNLRRPSPDPTRADGPSPTVGPSRGVNTSGSPSPATTGPRTPSPLPSSPPPPANYTPVGVPGATARPDGTVQVVWQPAATRPASYRILRADNQTAVQTLADGAGNSAIFGGVPLGQDIAFIVEAVGPDGKGYRSAQSNPVRAYAPPAAARITSASLQRRLPQVLTVQVMVDVAGDGGSTVTGYDLTIQDGRGVRATARNLNLGQRPWNLDIQCTDLNDLCFKGGGITISASLYNAAGVGPAGSAGSSIGEQAMFFYNANPTVMIVSSDVRCWNTGHFLQTCDPNSAGDLWVVRNNGPIVMAPNGNCITPDGANLRFTGSRCSERPRRWTLTNNDGNPKTRIQNQEGDIRNPCIYREGGRVMLRQPCRGGAEETWNFFLQNQPLGALPLTQLTAATTASAASAIGGAPIQAKVAVTSPARSPAGSPLAVTLVTFLFLPPVVRVYRRRLR